MFHLCCPECRTLMGALDGRDDQFSCPLCGGTSIWLAATGQLLYLPHGAEVAIRPASPGLAAAG